MKRTAFPFNKNMTTETKYRNARYEKKSDIVDTNNKYKLHTKKSSLFLKRYSISAWRLNLPYNYFTIKQYNIKLTRIFALIDLFIIAWHFTNCYVESSSFFQS